MRVCLSTEVSREATLPRRSLSSPVSLIFAVGQIRPSSGENKGYISGSGMDKNSLGQLTEPQDCWSSAKVYWSLDDGLKDKGQNCQAMENPIKA